MAARSSASLAAAAGSSTCGGALAPRRFSMAAMMVSKIFFRAYHFDVASTMVHGANSDSVSSSISSMAARYSSYFLWRAQSAAVTRQASSGFVFDGSETLLLLLLGDVQKELQDDGAVVGQHALELDDVAVGLAPRLLRDGALHALLQHATVPTVIENDHLAAVGDLQPEAPQPGPLLLVGAGSGDGVQLESARIEPLRQGGDGGALAGGVPAFEHDHGRHAVVPAGLFQIVQALLQRRQGESVILARELPLQVDVFQHGVSGSILVQGAKSRSPPRRPRSVPCRSRTRRRPRPARGRRWRYLPAAPCAPGACGPPCPGGSFRASAGPSRSR